jgi:hypothetical protein
VGREVEEEVGVSIFERYSSALFFVLNRALARARAIELDFTDGGDEEETMCPVCHESTSLLYIPLLGFTVIDPSRPSLRKQRQDFEMRTRSVRR